MSNFRNGNLKERTERLVADAEALSRTATEGLERLRVNLLEFRVHELRRQLVLARIQHACERTSATPLVAPPAAPVKVAIVREGRDDREDEAWAPASGTVH